MKGRDEEKKKSRSGLWGFVQLFLVLCFLGAAFLLSFYLSSLEMAPDTEIEQEDLQLLVTTVAVSPQSHRLEFDATGTVQVRAMTRIVPQVSGRVVAIDERAFPGGIFSEETVLFRIDPTDYELALERAKADVASAETRLEIQRADASTAVSEWRQMNPETPPPPLVAKKPQLKEARASLEAARSRVEGASLDLARTSYTLPFPGRITDFQMEKGQYVTAGQSYGQAYRLSSLEIDVPIGKEAYEWLMAAEDPRIRVSTDFSGDQVYDARIKRISAKLDPGTRFHRVILGLSGKAPDLLPDTFVHVRFQGPVKEKVWVFPLNAMQKGGQVWVVTPENTLRSIRPEIIQVTESVFVAESDGTTVRAVRGNLPEATEGTPVRVMDSREAGGGEAHADGE
jgi:RND family efflux transporter MFP subunit